MRIKPRDNISPGCIDAQVQGRGYTARGIVDKHDVDFRAATAKLGDHFASLILGSPVDDNNLIAFGIILVRQVVKRFADETLFVVAGNDYRNLFGGGRRQSLALGGDIDVV